MKTNTTIDPYNQYHSPFVGMGNNPINLIDPSGGRANGSNSYYSDSPEASRRRQANREALLASFGMYDNNGMIDHVGGSGGGGTPASSSGYNFGSGQYSFLANAEASYDYMWSTGTGIFAPREYVSKTEGHFEGGVGYYTFKFDKNGNIDWGDIIFDGEPDGGEDGEPDGGEDGSTGGGTTIDNTLSALDHYMFGDGSPANIGIKSINILLHSMTFIKNHESIINNTAITSCRFSVNMTGKIFHIGRTNVSYVVNFNNQTVTYTLFDGDGFWDPDFIDEYFLGDQPRFTPDGPGPNLERLGGTPYYYVPFTITLPF